MKGLSWDAGLKRLFVVLPNLIVMTAIAMGQTQTVGSEMEQRILRAPALIRMEHHILDSLADLGQKRWVNEAWTENEVKRYASIIYDLYEYDPAVRTLRSFEPAYIQKYQNKGWLIGDREIFQEASEHLPKLDAALVSVPIWLTIKVESMGSQPMENTSGGHLNFTEIRVKGIVTKIWKGGQFQTGQQVECYYMKEWGGPALESAKEYLLLLTPMLNYKNMTIERLANGGPYTRHERAFPIEPGRLIDRSHLFGAGDTLDINVFNNLLQGEIKKIKSWKGTLALPESSSSSAPMRIDSTARIRLMRTRYQMAPYDSLLKSEFHRYGLTDEKLERLKTMGLDIREHIIREEKNDPAFDAAFSDLVIIGKVKAIVGLPGVRSALFHSKTDVEIVDILKGPRPKENTIALMSESGPVTNDHDSVIANVYVTSSAKFEIGETSVFFLKNVFNDPSWASRNAEFVHHPSASLTDPAYIVPIRSTHRIIDSTIEYSGQIMPLESFVKKIKKVSRILDANPSE